MQQERDDQHEQNDDVEPRGAKRPQIIIGAATIALGSFYLFEALEYPLGTMQIPGAGVFPSLVAAGLILIGVLIVVTALLGRNLPEHAEADAVGTRRVLVLMAILTLYIVGLVTIGFTISSVVAVLAMVHVLGSTLGLLGRVIYSVVLVVVVELLFSGLFSIRFPGGLVGLLL